MSSAELKGDIPSLFDIYTRANCMLAPRGIELSAIHPLDEATLYPGYYTQDRSGMYDVRFYWAEESTPWDGDTYNPVADVSKLSNSFRGLLKYDSFNSPFINKIHRGRVAGNVISSVARFNAVQAELGSTPGVDAFELFQVDGTGTIPVGTCIELMADHKIGAADPVADWGEATHDRRLDDHGKYWIFGHAMDIKSMADRAAGLSETYGASIHEPKDTRPYPATKFIAKVDGVPLIWHNCVAAVALDGAILNDSFEANGMQAVAWEITSAKNVARLGDYVTLGIASQEEGTVAAGEQAMAAVRRLATNTAETLLKLYDIVPPDEYTDLELHQRKVDYWQTIVSAYTIA